MIGKKKVTPSVPFFDTKEKTVCPYVSETTQRTDMSDMAVAYFVGL